LAYDSAFTQAPPAFAAAKTPRPAGASPALGKKTSCSTARPSGGSEDEARAADFAAQFRRDDPPEGLVRRGIEPEAQTAQRADGRQILPVASGDDGLGACFIEEPIDHGARGFNGVALPAARARDPIADLVFARGAKRRLETHVADDSAFVQV